MSKGPSPIFVVQKHAARRLHYDFRLERGGVLWSWAIPKGPSLDPKDKRLAVHVEDHPRDYASFAGTIPAGEYGAGTLEIWDHGDWAPVGDPVADLARGEMKFRLFGERLRGHFVLIRLKPRPKAHGENWLLIKEHDEYEQAGLDAPTIELAGPLGSVSRPVLLKKARKKVAASKIEPAEIPAPDVSAASLKVRSAPAPRAFKAAMPKTQASQLASLVEDLPASADWLCEVKFDGYRMMMFRAAEGARLLTRNGLDWMYRLGGVALQVEAAASLVMLLDCELVALRADGISSFSDLQAVLADGRHADLRLFAFDILHLDGWDLRPCRLDNRKAVLASLGIWSDRLRYSDHHTADARLAREHACAMGLEGITAKRVDAPYHGGHGKTWVKLKCHGREEFVVLGWTPPAGSRKGLGALHLGFYAPDGSLHDAGGVGTGFSEAELTALRARLDGLAAGRPPAGLLATPEKTDRNIRCVKLALVAEVQFVGWSGTGRVRHAVFLGLREDKPASEVVRDIPVPQQPRAPVSLARSGSINTARTTPKP